MHILVPANYSLMYLILQYLQRKALLLLLFLLVFTGINCQTIDSTNLPLVIINTNGRTISDEPKISANLKIINYESRFNHPSDVANVYNGDIGIEIRGRYSASLPQKPYGFETRDDNGNVKNMPLLNMPAENDWILIANYNDKSFVRNSLAFQLFRNMGHYAPRSRLCEVLLNGNYEGIYLFTEKIKRDKNRVNISELDSNDNAGDSLTGGYIIAIDYYDSGNSWAGSYSPPGYSAKTENFVYNYPASDVITPQQKNFIKNYINAFEKTLYSSNFKDAEINYKGYVNLNSFIDYFIVNEVARNVDAYKKSCYYHKNRNSNGAQLEAGPVWDFDWAWKDIWDCSIFKQTDGSGWAYKVLQCDPWPTPTGWIPRMMEDPYFVGQLKNRYTFLRNNTLNDSYIYNYVDSVKSLVNDAQARHYDRWKILGIKVGAPEIELPASTYNEEIENLKSWIQRRLTWLDAQLLLKTFITESKHDKTDYLTVSPNPAQNFIKIHAVSKCPEVMIFSITGKKVLQFSNSLDNEIVLDISSLSPGVYIIQVKLTGGDYLTEKLIVD